MQASAGQRSLPPGALVALATPLKPGGREPDDAGLELLVEHVVSGGVRGISTVGSTGEGPRLTIEQRLGVTARVRSLGPEDLALVPAVFVANVRDARAEIAQLADIGVSAVLVAPPSYYPLTDDEVTDMYTELADSSDLPIVLYNIPQFTKVSISERAVAQLAAHSRVVGIKDSSRDMEYLGRILLAAVDARDFRVYTGTDTLLLASLVMGVDGTIAASANVAPELGTGICDAFAQGDLALAHQLQARLTSLVRACRRGAPPSGWKAALAAIGICAADCASPARSLNDALRVELEKDLRDLRLIGAPR